MTMKHVKCGRVFLNFNILLFVCDCVEAKSLMMFVVRRWQLSKTVKGDADEEISKYDGL